MCKHQHIKFSDGGLYIRCIDCPRRWVAVNKDFDIPDIATRGDGIADGETRHSPFVSPRSTPTPASKPKK